MINETRKILNKPDLNITATAVRVPVNNCHGESINIEFENTFYLRDVIDILSTSIGVKSIKYSSLSLCLLMFLAITMFSLEELDVTTA